MPIIIGIKGRRCRRPAGRHWHPGRQRASASRGGGAFADAALPDATAMMFSHSAAAVIAALHAVLAIFTPTLTHCHCWHLGSSDQALRRPAPLLARFDVEDTSAADLQVFQRLGYVLLDVVTPCTAVRIVCVSATGEIPGEWMRRPAFGNARWPSTGGSLTPPRRS
jgi:hypothetical protein